MASAQRRWMIATSTVCLLLIATTVIASNRPRKIDRTIERDGSRTEFHRVLGVIPSSRTVSDPSLHVSADLKRELKRLGLKLSPKLEPLASNTMRQSLSSLQARYSLSGDYAGTPKDAVDFFARQIAHPRRYTTATMDQFSGTCSDGRSQLEVIADSQGGRTWAHVSLDVR